MPPTNDLQDPLEVALHLPVGLEVTTRNDLQKTVSGSSPVGRPCTDFVVAVLTENRSDIMSLGMFTHIVHRRSDGDISALRSMVVSRLRIALSEDLISIGSLAGAEVLPWTGSTSELMARVQAAWPPTMLPAFETLRDVCWIANTQKGDYFAATETHYTVDPTTGALPEFRKSFPKGHFVD